MPERAARPDTSTLPPDGVSSRPHALFQEQATMSSMRKREQIVGPAVGQREHSTPVQVRRVDIPIRLSIGLKTCAPDHCLYSSRSQG